MTGRPPRPHAAKFCGSRLRERLLGHCSITAPCGCGCGQEVTRCQSKTTGSGRLYVNRDHFWAHRRREREEADQAHVTASSGQATRLPHTSRRRKAGAA